MKKKIYTIIASLLLITSLVGCTQAKKADTDSSKNPVTEYSSLDEPNEIIPGSMIHQIDLAKDESYSSTNDGDDVLYIEYDYTLNDISYAVRFSDDFNASISGMTYKDGYAFDDSDDKNYSEFSYVKADEGYVAHWLTTDGTYIFIAFDTSKLSEEDFKEVAKDYMNGTIREDS